MALVIEHLSKTFARPLGERVCAVDDFSLAIEPGELVVLVGPSGCGKTTTLRLIAGLEMPDAGTIAIDGQVVNGLTPKERDVAMVFQNPALYPHMTVYENLAFGLKLRQCPKPELQQRVEDAAETLGLAGYLDRLPMALSGGERQRVALGRALVRRPRVFLLDEPLSSLDPQTRARLRQEIVGLHNRVNATLIYVTHDQGEALAMGQRVAVMRNGRVEQVAGPMALYDQPANLFVAGFIGSPQINLLAGTLEAQDSELWFRSEVAPGAGPGLKLRIDDARRKQLEAFAGRKVILGVRPEHISAASAERAPGSEFEAQVERVESNGPDNWLHVSAGGHVLVVRAGRDTSATSQQTIHLAVNMAQVHFFDPETEKAIR